MKFKTSDVTNFIIAVLLFINPFMEGDLFSVLLFFLLGCYLIIINFKNPRVPILGIGFLLIIFFIGLSFGFFNGVTKYYFRDVWIFIKPVIIIYFATLLASRYKGNEVVILRLILFAGVISALYHFIEIIEVPNFQHLALQSIRDKTRRASIIEALSFALILHSVIKYKRWVFPKQYLYFFLGIIGLSILLYVSRTMFLVLFVFIGFLFNYFRFSIKAIIVFLVVITALTYIFSLPPQPDDTSVGRMINKIQKSPGELFFSSSDVKDKASINQNWRGYEAFRAITQTISNGSRAIIFGNGFGSLVDLKLVMHLGGSDFRYVPKIHDGYAQLFFKTGMVSIILYVAFLLSFYMQTFTMKIHDPDLMVLKKSIMGIIVTILLTTSTIEGIYNDSTLDSVLLISVFSFILLKRNSIKD